MGRVLLSIIEDTSGAHDTLVGGSNAATNAARLWRAAFATRATISFSPPANWASTAATCIPASPSSRRSASTPRASCDWQRRAPQARRLRRSARRDGSAGRAVQLPASARPVAGLRTGRRRDRSAIRRARPRDDDLCRTATPKPARAFENNAFYLAAGCREGVTMTAILRLLARIVLDSQRFAARHAVVGDHPQGPDPPHHRQPRPAGRRHAVLHAARLRRALQRARTRCARKARPMSRPAPASCRPKAASCCAWSPTPAAGTTPRPAPAPARATPCASAIRRKYLHACRENFLIEVAKHGMTKRDIVPNINFFMNVPIEPDGQFTIVDGVSTPGDYVEMVAEMDVLVRHLQLSADQQPLQRLQSDADRGGDLRGARGRDACSQKF